MCALFSGSHLIFLISTATAYIFRGVTVRENSQPNMVTRHLARYEQRNLHTYGGRGKDVAPGVEHKPVGRIIHPFQRATPRTSTSEYARGKRSII